MKTLRLVFGDQLTLKISSLKDLHPSEDVVLMVESLEENTRLRHHQQKITLVLSAMRHFASELRQGGLQVDYVTLDDPHNTGSFTGEVERAIQRHSADRLILTEPSEWRVREMVSGWPERVNIQVERARMTASCAPRRTLPPGQAGGRACAWNTFTGRCAEKQDG